MNPTTTTIHDGEAMKTLKMRLMTVLTMGAFLLQACEGDRTVGGTPVAITPTAPVSSTPTSTPTPDQAAVVNVAVNLPSGTPQTLATLALNNSIGAVGVGAAGTFALPIYAGGPQYADLLDQDGTVVATGFVSPASAAIDATSTAKALIYFAAGFYGLTLPYRVDVVDQISTVDGFGDVVTAVSNAIVAGGIGITPILGMMRHLRRHGHGKPMRLYYLTRDRSGTAFLPEIAAEGFADWWSRMQALPSFKATALQPG